MEDINKNMVTFELQQKDIESYTILLNEKDDLIKNVQRYASHSVLRYKITSQLTEKAFSLHAFNCFKLCIHRISKNLRCVFYSCSLNSANSDLKKLRKPRCVYVHYHSCCIGELFLQHYTQ